MYDEYDDAESERDFQRFGTSWEVAGLVRLDELTQKTGYAAPDGPYETLGGLIMSALGRIPQVGDKVVLPQFTATSFQEELETVRDGFWLARVTVMDDRRVERAILSPVTPEQAAALQEGGAL